MALVYYDCRLVFVCEIPYLPASSTFEDNINYIYYDMHQSIIEFLSLPINFMELSLNNHVFTFLLHGALYSAVNTYKLY